MQMLTKASRANREMPKGSSGLSWPLTPPHVLFGVHVPTPGHLLQSRNQIQLILLKGLFQAAAWPSQPPPNNKPPGLPATIVRRLGVGGGGLQVPLEGSLFQGFLQNYQSILRRHQGPGKQDYGGSALVSWSISISPKYLSTLRLELAAPLGIFSSPGVART